MIKEYKYCVLYRLVLLSGMIIAIYGAFELGKSYGFVITFISIICIIWFALLFLRLKIIITEEYIVADYGRLGKRIEYNWYQINRVSRIPFSFLWMYKIHCKNKPSLTFSNGIANYIDLLEEIIKRSPNAMIDDSVREFLQKKKNKQLKK
jgi:hypothetical protein